MNVAARQLSDPGFADDVSTTVARSGLDPRRLVLELTEAALMRADEASNRNLERLQQLGAFDRSFVELCDQRDGGLRLVETIIRLGHGLGLSVVAEGVERESQLERLRSVGCDGVQGFVLGRPAPPADIELLLKRRMEPEKPTVKVG